APAALPRHLHLARDGALEARPPQGKPRGRLESAAAPPREPRRLRAHRLPAQELAARRGEAPAERDGRADRRRVPEGGPALRLGVRAEGRGRRGDARLKEGGPEDPLP